MLLTIDAGNTNVTLGLFQGERLVHHWRLSSRRHRTGDELGLILSSLLREVGLSPGDLHGASLASVVPPLTPVLVEAAHRYLGQVPQLLTPERTGRLRLSVDRPYEVGADRIANAIGALAKYPPPLIVVDLGTATTLDAVDASGAYVGGAIAPGVEIAVEALYGRAANLRPVELAVPARALGRNTVDALRSGIVFGHAGLVDALVERIRAELGGQATVIATGGLAPVIAEATRTLQAVDPYLTLDGLRVWYEQVTWEERP